MAAGVKGKIAPLLKEVLWRCGCK